LLLTVITYHADAQIDNFDYRILRKLEASRTPGKTAFFKFVSKWNNPVCLVAPVTLLVTGMIKNDTYMKKSGLDVTESILATSLVNFALKKIFGRKRPFIRDITFTAVLHPNNNSFPSGHTTEAFSMATSMSLLYPKWYVIAPTFSWAAIIGYARMYLGVHYPTDVLAGATISSATSFLVYRANHHFLY
jgi:undecaprenyl-diphosphatase